MKKGKGVLLGLWICLLLALLAMVLGVPLFASPFLLVAFVLSIMVVVQGRVAIGIVGMLLSLMAMPGFYILMFIFAPVSN